MKDNRPKYRLEQLFEDGSEGEAKLYRIDEIKEDFSLNRRGFLSTTAVTAGTLFLAGCANKPAVKVISSGAQAQPEEVIPSDVPSSFSCPDFALAHQGAIYALAFSPDGTKLASGSKDNNVKLWEIPSGNHLWTQKVLGEVMCLTFSPDGEFLYAGTSQNLIIKWNVLEKKMIKSIATQTRTIRALGTTSMHNVLVSIHGDKILKYWDAGTLEELISVGAHTVNIACGAVAPDGSIAATGCIDSSIKLWDIPSGHLVDELNIHQGSINDVALSPDGGFLVSLDSLGNLYVTDLATRNILQELSVRENLTEITLSRDGALLFIQENKGFRLKKDTESRIWDVYEG
ncbi:MAG: WD40 repeat domain-containing protein, partial [Candidatus Aminicenantes bacterium]|nr:WD40 repeat domain-containing protein [Candidatus Aminicenantes bacterium]